MFNDKAKQFRIIRKKTIFIYIYIYIYVYVYKLRRKHKLRGRGFGSTLKNFASLWFHGLGGK